MLSYNVLNSWVEKMMKKSLPVKIKTSDITNLSTNDINKLKAGDIVLKKTGNQKHTYIVSYKEENQGICLTYTDASLVETVSYDYNSETHEWTYNSTDVTELGGYTETLYYNHYIEYYNATSVSKSLMFIDMTNSISTAFTFDSLKQYLIDNDFISNTQYLHISGYTYDISSGTFSYYVGIYYNTTNENITILTDYLGQPSISGSLNDTPTRFIDHVVSLKQ